MKYNFEKEKWLSCFRASPCIDRAHIEKPCSSFEFWSGWGYVWPNFGKIVGKNKWLKDK